MENNICVGIDIGTTKVTALIAKKLEEIYKPNDKLPLYIDKKSDQYVDQ